MGIGRAAAGVVAGLGLVGMGYAGLAGQDETTRSDDGAIMEEGELGAFRIRLGDCIEGAFDGEVESVQGVPCDGPHMLEAYHAFNLPEGSYPGDLTVGELADDGCYAAFEPWVGMSYEESVYGFSSLTPTEGSWNGVDDREVLCFVGNYDDTPKTGTAYQTRR
ncbi:MAG: septum formation family protein [Acidimicrobiia bacterium]|nr:septum formation family protein [Acidimicrobiia bacterium]MDH5520361.1 septum formation family protein [Acidimicrobiia bacterium]